MNCYVGMAKLIVKSCFQEVKPNRVIPVPQLQPLDARNIIKREVKDISTSTTCFALSEEVLKTISDEEVWKATLMWAEAKAQEREAAATKAVSQTDTDESYNSDDSEFGVSIHHMSLFGDDSDDDDSDDDDYIIDMIRRFEEEKRIEEKKRISKEKEKSLLKRMLESQSISGDDADEYYDSDDFADAASPMAGLMRMGEVTTNVYSLDDAAAAAAMWREYAQADAYESVAAKKAVKKFWDKVDVANAAKLQAATIIQAAERGRVVRVVVVIVAEATKVLQLSKFMAVDWEGIAVTRAVARAVVAMGVARAVVAMGMAGLMKTRAVGLVKAVVECDAATIIQAIARGRAVRLAALDAALLMRLRQERRRAAKEARRAWNAALDPSTWYRV